MIYILLLLVGMIVIGLVVGVLIRTSYYTWQYGQPGEAVWASRILKSGVKIHVYEIVLIPGEGGVGAYIRIKDGDPVRLIRFENIADRLDQEVLLGIKNAQFEFRINELAKPDGQGHRFEEQLVRLVPPKRRGW